MPISPENAEPPEAGSSRSRTRSIRTKNGHLVILLLVAAALIITIFLGLTISSTGGNWVRKPNQTTPASQTPVSLAPPVTPTTSPYLVRGPGPVMNPPLKPVAGLSEQERQEAYKVCEAEPAPDGEDYKHFWDRMRACMAGQGVDIDGR